MGRPSGTEPIARVYAEGFTQALADQLAREVEIAMRAVLRNAKSKL
eukprot:NODE_10314_length_216_cov_106.772455_g9699_i0.p2 GENE.NODE_10314_length_216_cov_106.772455_g9699_i0~~NODE_10314_length_216_cov_106.772455_g9699_i0.p2  ORF type:complete len:56 (-),score=31.02 NODE_10314_length_216_cov_106.772455_g9699_i0:47-184(-)